MAEYPIFGQRHVQWRMVFAVVAMILLPSVFATWLNGWHFFSFPLGTFLVWFGVPLGLIAVAMIVSRTTNDEEAMDP